MTEILNMTLLDIYAIIKVWHIVVGIFVGICSLKMALVWVSGTIEKD